jgi:hypothetical protein
MTETGSTKARKAPAPSPCASHRDYRGLEAEADALVAALGDLTELQQRFVEHRWRAQLLFFKCRIIQNRWRYYVARGVAVVGAVIVPALLGADFVDISLLSSVGAGAAFVVSLAVAIATALEEFVGWGKRWRLYRRSHDEMKAEGWRFVEGLDDYAGGSHQQGFARFAANVEDIIERYGEEYVTELLVPLSRQGAGKPSGPGGET